MSKLHPYQREAELIAASVAKERGHVWKAGQIHQGRCPQTEEVVIALRALMYARGELEILPDLMLTSAALNKPARANTDPI
jgi:hypothetical protein